MKISEMIKALEEIENKHGNLEIYEYNDWATISKYNHAPTVNKIYSQKWEDADWMKGQLSDGDLEEKDEELYDVDLTKPIVKGVII